MRNKFAYLVTSICLNVTLSLYVKVKWSRYRPGVAQRLGRGIALLFHDRRTRRGSASRLGHTLPPSNTRYPFYRRLDGPQGRSGRAENLAPTGIRSRTVQPVASRNTDWATRPSVSVCSAGISISIHWHSVMSCTDVACHRGCLSIANGTWVKNNHYSPRNNPEERRSHLRHCGSVKSYVMD